MGSNIIEMFLKHVVSALPPMGGGFFVANVKIWTKIRVWKGEQTKGNVHEKIVNVLCVGVRCIIWGVR